MEDPKFPIVHWCAAADVEIVRRAAIQFFDEFYGVGKHQEKLEAMLPFGASPTGEDPPTVFICWWKNLRRSVYEAANAFRIRNNVPSTFTPTESLEAFLESQGLRRVS